MKVLIGFDGSECAKAAIRELQRAGLPADAEAIVLSVAEMLVHLPSPVATGMLGVARQDLPQGLSHLRPVALEATLEAGARAREGVDLVTALFPGWKVRGEVATDPAHWALLNKAAEWPADLVVLGSHGRSALGRIILGSVSHQVLSQSPCSVRVSEYDEGAAHLCPHSPRLILAIDGSSDSGAAVEAIMLRAWPLNTEVRIVTAVDLQMLGVLPLIKTNDENDDDPLLLFRQRADSIADELREVGLTATSVVVVGDPKRVLLDEANTWDADCIFIGATGQNRIDKILLGSVASAVAARSYSSVEVVR